MHTHTLEHKNNCTHTSTHKHRDEYIQIYIYLVHRRDNPKTWVQVLASVIFLFCPLRSFFLCYNGEALEGPISTAVCINSTMLIQIATYKYEIYIYKK